MGSPSPRTILANLTFSKTSGEVRDAVHRKVAKLSEKILEREARITSLRESYQITDTDMIQLLSQQARDAVSNARITSTTYSVGSGDDCRVIGAGVVQNLSTEQLLIEQEKEHIDRLTLVARNLRPIRRYGVGGESFEQDSFELSYADLEFLGF